MVEFDLETLQKLRQKTSFTKLYHIKSYPGEVLFGVRAEDTTRLDLDRKLVSEELKKNLDTLGVRDACVKILTSPHEEVSALLTEVEPYVEGDGGRIEIASIDENEGEVVLSLHGACSGCPSSVVTLKIGIKRVLGVLPWFKNVKPDRDPEEPDFGFKL